MANRQECVTRVGEGVSIGRPKSRKLFMHGAGPCWGLGSGEFGRLPGQATVSKCALRNDSGLFGWDVRGATGRDGGSRGCALHMLGIAGCWGSSGHHVPSARSDAPGDWHGGAGGRPRRLMERRSAMAAAQRRLEGGCVPRGRHHRMQSGRGRFQRLSARAGCRPPPAHLPREHREASCAVLLADAILFVLLDCRPTRRPTPCGRSAWRSCECRLKLRGWTGAATTAVRGDERPRIAAASAC